MLVHETPFNKTEPSRVPLPLYIYTQDIPPHTPFHTHILIPTHLLPLASIWNLITTFPVEVVRSG